MEIDQLPLAFLSGGGEMGALMRAHDWTRSAFGAPDTWPQSLRSMTSACLNSPLPSAILWGPDLRMLYNDAYSASLADRHPAALGRPVADVWGTTWTTEVAMPFHTAMQDGRGFERRRVELPIVRNGRTESTWWDFSASPIRGEHGEIAGLLNQAVEITDRVHVEEASRRASDELLALNASLESRIADRTAALLLHENIVQSHRSPVCAFDREFRLIAFNRAHSDEFFRIFGHRVQLGEVFPDLFPPEQGDVIRGFMARALAGETYTVVEEFGDPDLAKPYWEVAYYPLRDLDGRIVGAFHHANDISARLRAQADLQTAQEALRQSQKMEAIGQLTGGLAHDFNNLLAAISGSLELVKRRVATGRIGDVERYLDVGLGATRRAAALTHRLLAFSRRQTLEPKALAINRLIADMADLIRRTIGPAIELDVLPDAAPWTVKADASQIENALLNLCINARDAMPAGGKLTIETVNRRIDERAARGMGIEPGEYLVMCVSDDGVGMTADVAARAFDPFFTTKPIGMGTGLGLSMIFGFAKQSGGHARIDSEPGRGTRVSLYLPRVPDLVAVESAPDGAIEHDRRPAAGQTVLVVDDEAGVRMLVQEVLVEAGYTVLEADDGPAALKIIESPARIDLLVSDVGLPGGMNGRQVADAARTRRPELEVLFITGYAESAVLSHGHLDPGMHVMTKPFELDALLTRIRGLLDATSTA